MSLMLAIENRPPSAALHPARSAVSVLPRRLHFSLRTLFVVMTILGVLLGWLGVQLKWIHDRREALRWIVDYRARAVAAESRNLVPPRKGEIVSPPDKKAPWSLRILGEGGVERLEVYQDWLNEDARYSLDELSSLFPEAKVESRTNRHERDNSNDDKERLLGEGSMDRSATTQ